MLYDSLPPWSSLRETINSAYRLNEQECVQHLLGEAELSEEEYQNITRRARKLILAARQNHSLLPGIDNFLSEYDLSTEEGIALMCLAEALLRVPDKENIDRLIKDKLQSGNWSRHLNQSDSLAVNAATWALMLTGKFISESTGNRVSRSIKKMVTRTGEPVIRNAVASAMKILGKQFVMGRSIEEALQRAQSDEAKGYRHSYDMLGEAALSLIHI